MLNSGDVFAGFTIERLLGQGGMGSVYLARHPRLGKLTALKLLNRELFADREIRARFEREADLVAQLDHPNIVEVYDRGTEHDQLWISMQFVDGVDAASVNPVILPPERAVQIIEGVAAALDYAHSRGVLHRDVKPANIILARAVAGHGERVFLSDFGIARLREDSTHLTQTGMFTATLAYASPEQMTGAHLDHTTDQYSLACALYWLLIGIGPYDSPHPAELIRGHLQLLPPPVSLRRPGLTPAMDAVLTKAMAKRPTDRFPSCTAFAKAARRALTDPRIPTPPQPMGTAYPSAPTSQPGYPPGYQAPPPGYTQQPGYPSAPPNYPAPQAYPPPVYPPAQQGYPAPGYPPQPQSYQAPGYVPQQPPAPQPAPPAAGYAAAPPQPAAHPNRPQPAPPAQRSPDPSEQRTDLLPQPGTPAPPPESTTPESDDNPTRNPHAVTPSGPQISEPEPGGPPESSEAAAYSGEAATEQPGQPEHAPRESAHHGDQTSMPASAEQEGEASPAAGAPPEFRSGGPAAASPESGKAARQSSGSTADRSGLPEHARREPAHRGDEASAPPVASEPRQRNDEFTASARSSTSALPPESGEAAAYSGPTTEQPEHAPRESAHRGDGTSMHASAEAASSEGHEAPDPMRDDGTSGHSGSPAPQPDSAATAGSPAHDAGAASRSSESGQQPVPPGGYDDEAVEAAIAANLGPEWAGRASAGRAAYAGDAACAPEVSPPGDEPLPGESAAVQQAGSAGPRGGDAELAAAGDAARGSGQPDHHPDGDLPHSTTTGRSGVDATPESGDDASHPGGVGAGEPGVREASLLGDVGERPFRTTAEATGGSGAAGSPAAGEANLGTAVGDRPAGDVSWHSSGGAPGGETVGPVESHGALRHSGSEAGRPAAQAGGDAAAGSGAGESGAAGAAGDEPGSVVYPAGGGRGSAEIEERARARTDVMPLAGDKGESTVDAGDRSGAMAGAGGEAYPAGELRHPESGAFVPVRDEAESSGPGRVGLAWTGEEIEGSRPGRVGPAWAGEEVEGSGPGRVEAAWAGEEVEGSGPGRGAPPVPGGEFGGYPGGGGFGPGYGQQPGGGYPPGLVGPQERPRAEASQATAMVVLGLVVVALVLMLALVVVTLGG
ncbi:serine/threonine-protein kinase [Nocardia sp. IFM 10818]